MVAKMTENKWRRLDYDSLNPQIKLNHARGPGGIWDHLMTEDGNHIYQWVEEWLDDEGNEVTYGLRYRASFERKEDPCTLEVVVIYLPAEITRRSNKPAVH